MSFEDWNTKRKAKKAQKKADAADRRLDSLEEANSIRMATAERKKEQQKRASDIKWVEKHLDSNELRDQVNEAKGELWVVRDKLYDIIHRSVKEYSYLEKQPESPGRNTKMDNLNKKYKNAFYALAMVQQTIDRLNEMPSEYEWKQIMKDLTNGYKLVNAISTGSEWITRLSFWMQKTKMETKGMVSLSAMEDCFGKPIDQILQEEKIDKAATDILVTAQAQDLNAMSKQDILEAAKNGVFVTVQPQEAINVAKSAESQMKESQQTIGMESDSAPVTKELSLREQMNMMKNM